MYTAARPLIDTSAPTKLVIVHDYLTQRGGAERVVLAMHRAFPNAPIYTSLFQPETTFPEFGSADVRAMAVNLFPPFRKNHRLAMPLLAPMFSQLNLRAETVLCSSSGWAHGAKVDGKKIVYCHAPARWLYQTDRYLAGRARVTRFGFAPVRSSLIRWDRRAARSADRYLTQSRAVQKSIQQVYGIKAEIVPAPYAVSVKERVVPVDGIRPGYFLCVSRLMRYKNVDAVLAAFSGTPDARLVVVGDGPERERLGGRASSNCQLISSVSDGQLAWLYANCRALVAASYEDYGLTPIEAAAFGKPSVVLRWGGFLDTVIENETGIFFDQPTPEAIRSAVLTVNGQFNGDDIRSHASRFSEERFIERLKQIVAREAEHA